MIDPVKLKRIEAAVVELHGAFKDADQSYADEVEDFAKKSADIDEYQFDTVVAMSERLHGPEVEDIFAGIRRAMEDEG